MMSGNQARGTQPFSIHLLNSFCKNKHSVYELLSGSQGLFLPKLNSRAITEKFLMKALKKEIYLIQRINVSPAPSLKEKASGVDLFEEIMKLLPGKDLGYDSSNLPDKQYLCDILYTLKHDHPFFAINSEFNTIRELDEE